MHKYESEIDKYAYSVWIIKLSLVWCVKLCIVSNTIAKGIRKSSYVSASINRQNFLDKNLPQSSLFYYIYIMNITDENRDENGPLGTRALTEIQLYWEKEKIIDNIVNEVFACIYINTKKNHVFAPMGRFQLESIYLYFPPSSQLLYLCFCPGQKGRR